MLQPFWLQRLKLRQFIGAGAAILGALFLVACGGTDEPTTPPNFGTTVVLGASLTDTGNACAASPSSCPPSPPYAAGRYSNGTL